MRTAGFNLWTSERLRWMKQKSRLSQTVSLYRGLLTKANCPLAVHSLLSNFSPTVPRLFYSSSQTALKLFPDWYPNEPQLWPLQDCPRVVPLQFFHIDCSQTVSQQIPNCSPNVPTGFCDSGSNVHLHKPSPPWLFPDCTTFQQPSVLSHSTILKTWPMQVSNLLEKKEPFRRNLIWIRNQVVSWYLMMNGNLFRLFDYVLTDDHLIRNGISCSIPLCSGILYSWFLWQVCGSSLTKVLQ